MSVNIVSDADASFGSLADRRAAVAREDAEREAQRQEQLAAQTSALAGPTERICTWEKLHALALPRLTTHKLVGVIAQHTALTVQQVQDEQRRRYQVG